MELWTKKYRPTRLSEIVSQKKAVDEAAAFLDSWKPGKALLLHGPPGTGKTLLAETLARERNWHLLAINASDKRSADEITNALREATKNHILFFKGKLILVDEVDGMGSGDRGGVAALIDIIKESRFPIIITANDIYDTKLRSLRNHCIPIKFHKVTVPSMEKRLEEICSRENLKCDEGVLKNLARWSQGDLRSAITDLQTLGQGMEQITEEDFTSLGFREREVGVFDIMPIIFRSRNISAARKAIQDSDMDSDEIFWWVESNLSQEFKDPESLAKATDLLSKADILRARVRRQQNWRFKAIMSDLLACVSLSGKPAGGFIRYSPPDRLIMLGRTKGSRQSLKSLSLKIGMHVHCSTKIVKASYLPHLKAMLSESGRGIELTAEEVEMVKEAV